MISFDNSIHMKFPLFYEWLRKWTSVPGVCSSNSLLSHFRWHFAVPSSSLPFPAMKSSWSPQSAVITMMACSPCHRKIVIVSRRADSVNNECVNHPCRPDDTISEDRAGESSVHLWLARGEHRYLDESVSLECWISLWRSRAVRAFTNYEISMRDECSRKTRKANNGELNI